MFLAVVVGLAVAAEPVEVRTVEHLGGAYTVVSVALGGDADVRLYGGRVGLGFADALAWAEREGRAVVALTNGGMYDPDYHPVGLFIANGEVHHDLNLHAGGGNFGLKPNGVFWVGTDGVAHVTVSESSPVDPATVRLATQSGPLLLVDGAVHPAFREASPNQLPRNGVGVSPDGALVHLVMSETSVRFHDLATLFRDVLGCEDALYLDGVVSNLWTPAMPSLPSNRYAAVLAVTRPR